MAKAKVKAKPKVTKTFKTVSEEGKLLNDRIDTLDKRLSESSTTAKNYSYEKFYTTPSTQTVFLGMATRTMYLDQLCVKLATAPTAADGEILAINIHVNGVAILSSPYLIDENKAADELHRLKLSKGLKPGDLVELDMVYTPGTLDTLAGICIAIPHRLK